MRLLILLFLLIVSFFLIAPIFDNNFSMRPRFIESYDVFNRDDYIC